MVARFTQNCPKCNCSHFIAEQTINDFPNPNIKDAWRNSITFACSNCANIVSEITTSTTGKVVVSTNFNT